MHHTRSTNMIMVFGGLFILAFFFISAIADCEGGLIGALLPDQANQQNLAFYLTLGGYVIGSGLLWTGVGGLLQRTATTDAKKWLKYGLLGFLAVASVAVCVVANFAISFQNCFTF